MAESATFETSGETGEPSGLVDLLQMSDNALDTKDEEKDPSFDLDESMKHDTDHNIMINMFCEDWATHLDRADRVPLGLFPCFQLTKVLNMEATKAEELAGMMIGKSDRTVRD